MTTRFATRASSGSELACVTAIVALGMLAHGRAFGQAEEQQNAFRAQALNSHNSYRAMYVNGTALVLPTSGNDVYTVLNTGSASWANYLASTGEFKHSSAANRTIGSSGEVAGENIFGTWTSQALSPANLARLAVDSWYAEVGSYSYLRPLDRSIGSTGHFTQVVWVSTTTVGCGYSVAPDSANAGYNNYVVVCRYDPAGNLQDARAYASNVPMLRAGKPVLARSFWPPPR